MVLAAVVTAPFWIPVRLAMAIGANDGCFLTCSQLLSPIPGVLGLYLRRGFYWVCLESYAWDASVGFSTWFSHPQVRIGKGVYIGGRCTLGMCEIGDGALIGSNVDVLSGRHQHRFDDASIPVQDQGGAFARIRIGRNCWIGNSSVIMADIGHDCVIGAGSVVVKPIPPSSVAAGNPATVKKSRALASAFPGALKEATTDVLAPCWLHVALHPPAV